MKGKLVLFLMSAAVLCALFVGCGEDKNPTGTTDSDANLGTFIQDATGLTEPSQGISTESLVPDVNEITYIQYNAMSAEEQQEVMNSFDSVEEFLAWLSGIQQIHQDLLDKTKPQNETTEITEPNENTEATENTCEPDETIPNDSVPANNEVTYLDYHAMSGAEQKKFINSFETIDAFIQWHDAAEQAYKDSLPEIDGSTPIDLDDYFGNGD